MLRKVVLAALCSCLLLAGSVPSQADANCPQTVRGWSGNCGFICYLTAIAWYRDENGDIQYECYYGECYSFCDQPPV